MDPQSSPSHPPHRVGIMEERTSLGVGNGPSGHVCAAQGSPRSEQSGAEPLQHFQSRVLTHSEDGTGSCKGGSRWGARKS